MRGDEASVAYDIPEVLILGGDFVGTEVGGEIFRHGSPCCPEPHDLGLRRVYL